MYHISANKIIPKSKINTNIQLANSEKRRSSEWPVNKYPMVRLATINFTMYNLIKGTVLQPVK